MTTPRRTRFYFEYSPEEQADPDLWRNRLEEEGYLANYINMGREVVAHLAQYEWQSCPELVAPPHGERPEIYYDAIAWILQAAAHEGLDPKQLCLQGLSLQRWTYEESLECAQRREADDHARTVEGGKG
jgi:hypothetical protein